MKWLGLLLLALPACAGVPLEEFRTVQAALAEGNVQLATQQQHVRQLTATAEALRADLARWQAEAEAEAQAHATTAQALNQAQQHLRARTVLPKRAEPRIQKVVQTVRDGSLALAEEMELKATLEARTHALAKERKALSELKRAWANTSPRTIPPSMPEVKVKVLPVALAGAVGLCLGWLLHRAYLHTT